MVRSALISPVHSWEVRVPPGRRLIRWHGVVLYRHTVAMMLLVPADSLGPRRPDEHFATEAGAAAGAGRRSRSSIMTR